MVPASNSLLAFLTAAQWTRQPHHLPPFGTWAQRLCRFRLVSHTHITRQELLNQAE